MTILTRSQSASAVLAMVAVLLAPMVAANEHVPTLGFVPGPGEAPTPPSNPYLADDERVLEQGRRLFINMNCYGCHGGHAGGGMGPSLRDEAWIYGGEPHRVFASIAEGRPYGMPAWGGLLPDDVIWQLVTYIESLRSDHEPDPPR